MPPKKVEVKKKVKLTQKPEKGVAVLGPETLVEIGDTDLRSRMPIKKPPVLVKVSSYYMNNREIFVNFINYCDISYMPSNIYNNMPIIEVNGIKCAHPHFMMVDAYRVLTDPMTSYWRLDKSIKRFQKLLKYYPIDTNSVDKKIELKSNPDVLKVIRKKIIHMSDLVVVGFYGYDYLVKKVSDDLALNNYPFYEAISKDLEKDARKALKILTNKFGNKITTKELDYFTSETCSYLIGEHFHYGILANRLIISGHHKNTIKTKNFSDIIEKLYDDGQINKNLLSMTMAYKDQIDDLCNKNLNNDYKILDYLGMKTLISSYFLKIRDINNNPDLYYDSGKNLQKIFLNEIEILKSFFPEKEVILEFLDQELTITGANIEDIKNIIKINYSYFILN